MSARKTRNNTSLGVLFWIATVLLVTVILMFSFPSIRRVLDDTNFVEVVFTDQTADEVLPPPQSETTPSTVRALPAAPPDDSLPETEPPLTSTEQGETEGGEQINLEEAITQPSEEQPSATEEEAPQRSEVRTATIQLYFIRVSDSGQILSVPVTRAIETGDGPLTRTIEALLAGPEADDLNRGLLSLVPRGANLRSARVASGVAFLDFNEEFRFNAMGLEGVLAQLQQVVQTATQFSTVDAVQILIEGQTIDYLGGDGVYIGRPLTIEDLRV